MDRKVKIRSFCFDDLENDLWFEFVASSLNRPQVAFYIARGIEENKLNIKLIYHG